jgi:aspartate-semialdehyde dehydrogenase
MNSNGKTIGLAHPDATRGFYRVAIVGAASLKGKEVAEVLEQRNFPATEVKLLDDDETLGQLEALKDEITFIQGIRAEQFEGMDFTFFASDAESTLKNWKQAQASGSAIVDLSYALAGEPGASVRAPWLERQLGLVSTPELQPGPAVIAHPISVVLALLISRVQAAAPIAYAAAVVYEPASEYAQKGMDELHQQTVNLLSFQPLPKKIFDVQIAFNMISKFGDESTQSISAVSDRITRHYRKITGDARLPIPSVLTLQAPVFHSHAVAINLQLENVSDVERISAALAGEHVSVMPPSQEAPNNVNAAGQNDVLVSVTPDASNPKSVWLWAAFDNLRVAAATAVESAESMAAARPRGKIQ